MSIRERNLFTLQFVENGTSRQQIPRDAVFHLARLSCEGGVFSSTQGAAGTGPKLVPGFPFTLMRRIRIIRNGSDIVYSASGEQFAKEHYFLNAVHPQARMYTSAANVETLLTQVSRGMTVPANSQGIGSNISFKTGDAPNAIALTKFDFQGDIMFQTGVDDDYYATLVDARPLADFAIEIDWASIPSQIAEAGVTNGATTVNMSVSVLSVDQDNVANGVPYGTFKRSQYSQNAFPYGSQNNQVMLPRGNMLYGLIMSTKAFKAGSAINPIAENAVLGDIELRVNTNLSLKKFTFKQLQGNNLADHGGRTNVFDNVGGGPEGWALLPLVNATQTLRESIPTFAFDMLDLQLGMKAIGEAQNGPTTAATNPVLDILIEEVIPGVSVSANAPQGAQNGSIAATSAKPYGR